jgi:tripartite ATP-independent transporter DctP family solute receptor
MKRRFLLAAPLLIAMGQFISPVGAQEIQERTIKLGHFMNPGNPISLGARKFAEIVSAKSDGKLKVREFPSGQLGPEGQQQSALIGGTQEITIQASSHLVGTIKDFGLFDFPFIVQNEAQADQLHDGPAGKALIEKLPAKGLTALGYWENGFRHVTNSKRPVKTLKDLAGLKIRIQANPVFIETFKAFNANPVPMSFSELYTALESGAVDAQENPLAIIQSSKFYEVQKYASLTNHAYGNVLVLVGKRFWDKLSPTEQKILQEAFVEAQAYQRQESRKQAQAAVADLRAKEMQVNEVAAGELDRMRQAIQPVTEKLVADYDPAIVKIFNAEIERIRKTP